MDTLKNNKTIKRIISLFLCVALIFTTIQVDNLINKDISGLADNEVDLGVDIGAAWNSWTHVSNGLNK